jgi:serine/threonine-protein phosphatase 6 catalytic subunit
VAAALSLFAISPKVLDHSTHTPNASMVAYTPDKWIDQLMDCQHLPEPEMKILCERVRAILMEESNIQPVSSPVTICGDIHGQFWDLLELLRKGGNVPETSYIFMVSLWVSRGHAME